MTTGTKIGYALLGVVVAGFMCIMIGQHCDDEPTMTCPNTTQAEFVETGECY